MEPLSEFVKRALQERLKSESGSPGPAAETGNSASAAKFPSEPFPCPACGQMLAPTCRVCVACKHTIDPAEVALPKEAALPAAPAPTTESRPEPVRFSWPIFFAVLGISCLLVFIFQGFWKDQQQVVLAMGGVQSLAGVWVFFDALRLRVPRPLRWAVGSMLLPLVIFPWYLARRRTPQSAVPFLEAVWAIRLVLVALLLFLLANLIFYLVQGPPPAKSPAPPSKERNSGQSSKPRIANLQPAKMRSRSGGQRRVSGIQVETSAPSDAWQT